MDQSEQTKTSNYKRRRRVLRTKKRTIIYLKKKKHEMLHLSIKLRQKFLFANKQVVKKATARNSI